MGMSLKGMLLAVAAVLLVPVISYSAGLGKLTVRSALGQPLDAEIEIVSLQPGEEDSFLVRLASREAFEQAGIEASPALAGARFTIERRGGKPVIRVTTTQPVNDPFLNVLVELQWPSGRLARHYTFLVDPIEYKGAQAVAAGSPKATAPAAAGTSVAELPKAAVAGPEKSTAEQGQKTVEPRTAAPPRASSEAAPIKAAAEPSGARLAAEPPSAQMVPLSNARVTYQVKRGDTLGAIARKRKPEGVTFNQMLIALYQGNQNAFIRGNINLIRAGEVLTLPSQEQVSAIDPADASRQVISQMDEFARYRRQKGAAVAAAPTGSRQRQVVGGRISVKRAAHSM